MFELPDIISEGSDKTLGGLLAAVREEKGLTIETVARDTRIRAQRLREIENDDHSHFVHPSYARLFLVDYAKYLGVSFQKIRDLLPEAGECGSEGYQYLQDLPDNASAVRIARRVRPRRRLLPAFAFAGLFIVCLLGAFQLWVTKRNIDRLGSEQIARMDRRELDQPISESAKPSNSRPETSTLVEPGSPSPDSAVPTLRPQAGAKTISHSDDRAALFVGGSRDRRIQ